jgi:predicted RNA-binding Zn-ribbon protein involved in translation (DUF1610 family)
MENNTAAVKTEVVHICCNCAEKMELYSSEECTAISEDLDPKTADILDFQVFKCPSCDEQIWILLRD